MLEKKTSLKMPASVVKASLKMKGAAGEGVAEHQEEERQEKARTSLISQGASATAQDLRAPENGGSRRKGMAWDHAGGEAPIVRGRDKIAAEVATAEAKKKAKEKEREASARKQGKVGVSAPPVS